jgi:hypothetical protein
MRAGRSDRLRGRLLGRFASQRHERADEILPRLTIAAGETPELETDAAFVIVAGRDDVHRHRVRLERPIGDRHLESDERAQARGLFALEEEPAEAHVERLERERRLAADELDRDPDIDPCIAAEVRSYRHPSEQVSSFFTACHEKALRRMGDNRDIPVGLVVEQITFPSSAA